MREPLHNDVHPIPVQPMRASATRTIRRWQAIGAAGLVLGILALGWVMYGYDPGQPAIASPAAAVKATDALPKQAQVSDQAKAEIALLRDALAAADKVVGHQRHHSQKMWDMLAERITPQEAWWQGGPSTCDGWVDAGKYEIAVGKLKGKEVTPPPVPAEGLKFCQQARERK